MSNRLAGVCALLLALAACGGASQGAQSIPASVPPAPAASPTASPSRPPSTPARPSSASASPVVTVASSLPKQEPAQIYFSTGGKLVPEAGSVNVEQPAREALERLLQGPRAADHFTEIPKGTKLLGVTIKDGVAFASFNSALFASGQGLGMQVRLAQVVYTLTQFPGIGSVQFLQDGKPLTMTTGEGFPLNRPLGRQQLAQFQS